jgi:hypothetical protein
MKQSKSEGWNKARVNDKQSKSEGWNKARVKDETKQE